QKIERLSALQRDQRVRTVADSADFMPVMDQRAADEFPKRGLMFSDQYTRHSCLRSAPDNVANTGQVTEVMRIIEAVANNTEIRAVETDEIGFEIGHPLALFVQHQAGLDHACPARDEFAGRKGEGASRFQNIINQQDLAARDRIDNIAGDDDVAAAHRLVA